MSIALGDVIAGSELGESGSHTAVKSDNRNEAGNNNRPEIIGGYESEEPRTERIASDRESGNGPRLTKSGKVDGRTLRGKRGVETVTQKSVPVVGIEKLDLTEVIYSVHAMLAGITAVAELELDRDESEKLGDAIKNVGQYYGATFDPKKVAIFQLCVVAGGIYGTRVFAIRNRLMMEREKNSQPKPQSIPRQQPQPQGLKVNGKATEPGVPFEVLGFGNGDAAL
jgi:hypothetical protein